MQMPQHRGMGMISYDWRMCPGELPPPQGPAYYGPLASDVGTRAFGEFEPMPDVELAECPGVDSTALLIGAGLLALVFMGGKKR